MLFWNLLNQELLRASRRVARARLHCCCAPLALLFEPDSAPPAAGSAVRLRTTVTWATVAMDLLDADFLGSDDDIDQSGSEFGDEKDGCASYAAQRADSEPQEVSPHAHRGAELDPPGPCTPGMTRA